MKTYKGTILVAGGLGYIGSNVSVQLIQAGYKVVIADDTSNSLISRLNEIRAVLQYDSDDRQSEGDSDADFLKFEKVDLTNLEPTLGLFERYRPDVVIALAGLKSVNESIQCPIKYHHVNLSIITNLLSGMERYNCPHLIFSSSSTVYDYQEDCPYTENSSIAKIRDGAVDLPSTYAVTKYLIERILFDIAKRLSQLRITILRYFNPVGNHHTGYLSDNPKRPSNLFPIITKSITENTGFQIYGQDYGTPDGTCQRDFISVLDVASAHVAVLGHRSEATNIDVFNVGLGYPVSVLQVVREYENITGVGLDYTIGDRREGDVAISYCDSTKIRKIGWRPQYTIEDCIRQSYTSISVTGDKLCCTGKTDYSPSPGGQLSP